MAVNGNGWTRWLVGALWGILVLALTTIGTNVIANDKASRERDSCVEKEIVLVERRLSEKIEKIHIEQTTGFTQVLISIERLKGRIEAFHNE